MKQIIITLFIFITCNLFAQTDTVNTKVVTNYSYEQLNGKHWYVIKTTHTDSSETIQRIPFTKKADVVAYAKRQTDIADSLAALVQKDIDKRLENIKTIEDQVKKYNDFASKEIAKNRGELFELRTRRKLVLESKEKNKGVK